MDFNKLREDLVEKKITDVQLKLIDYDGGIIILDVHKIVLVFSSSFFYKLFSFGNSINNKNIDIFVDDRKIAYDFIMSFYGISIKNLDTYYLLKTIKCKDYFCISIDISILYDIKMDANVLIILLYFECFDYINNYNLLKQFMITFQKI